MSPGIEKILQVGDDEVRLLFTNRALGEAEESLGKGTIEVLQDFQQGGSLREIAAFLRAGMEAARRKGRVNRRPYTMNDAYEVMDELGFSAVAVEVIDAISDILTSGQDDSKN